MVITVGMTTEERVGRSLRSRVSRSIALVTAVAVVLFGVPLGVVIDRLIQAQTLTSLQRDATRGLASVPDNVLEVGASVRAPRSTADTLLAVYDARGQRVAGAGPQHSALAARVSDGREHDGDDSAALAVVIPVLSDTTVAGSIRAATPLSRLHGRVYRAWGLLAVLAGLIIAVAVLLARSAARRISEPFEQITAAAGRLGAGCFDMHLPHWGIPEADTAAQALVASSRELDTLLQHERAFTRDASHQLRTPLAGALLNLEKHPPDLPAALESVRHLERTIADLLALRNLTSDASCDPTAVAAEAVERWWGSSNRSVTLRSDHPEAVAVPAAALRQCLDVLLDNAIRHGAGPVTVTVEPHGDSVIVEVADQGIGFPNASAPGTGLELASRVVERSGGSLLIRRRAPHARVALLVPLATIPGQGGPS
ncbi:MAG: HAMP domain-containing sensor histidine kinase [Mycobacteriales bacterium]